MEINNNTEIFDFDKCMRATLKTVNDHNLRKLCLLITQEFSRRGIADLFTKLMRITNTYIEYHYML